MKKEKFLLALNGCIFILAAVVISEEDVTTAIIFGLVGLFNLASIPFIQKAFFQTQIFINLLNAATSALIAIQMFHIEKGMLAAMYCIAAAGYLVATVVFLFKFRKIR